MIDKFSRFKNAVAISNFGAPNYIFSDNGGEFIGDDFYDMYGKFNIKVSRTASFSPRRNRTCERHIHLITKMLLNAT